MKQQTSNNAKIIFNNRKLIALLPNKQYLLRTSCICFVIYPKPFLFTSSMFTKSKFWLHYRNMKLKIVIYKCSCVENVVINNIYTNYLSQTKQDNCHSVFSEKCQIERHANNCIKTHINFRTLENNFIGSIPNQSFSGNKRLSSLRLEGNPIRSYGHTAFSNLPLLRDLYVIFYDDYCFISWIIQSQYFARIDIVKLTELSFIIR